VAAIVIDRVQTMQLGEALAAELKVTFGDEMPNRPKWLVKPAHLASPGGDGARLQ
jgi:hypothetical protein